MCLQGSPAKETKKAESRSSLYFYPLLVERKHHELEHVHCGVFITPEVFMLLCLCSI